METMTFGTYIYNKRKECRLTLNALANLLKISPTYLCDVEKNKRKAFKPDRLLLLAEILNITDEKELYYYYDLAGYSRDSLAFDVSAFMFENPELIDFVRKIKYKKMISEEYVNNMLSTIYKRERNSREHM